MNSRALLISCLLPAAVIFPSCSRKEAPPPPPPPLTAILPEPALIHPGDIIVRQGKGYISGLFLELSAGEKKYSHAGFITLRNGTPNVIHSIGGEDQASSLLREEPLAVFCRTEETEEYAIYRYRVDKKVIAKADSIARELLRQKVAFDPFFELQSDSLMYCTEFIYKVFMLASNGDISIPLSGYRGQKYVAVDNLYLHPFSQLVYHHSYSKRKKQDP